MRIYLQKIQKNMKKIKKNIKNIREQNKKIKIIKIKQKISDKFFIIIIKKFSKIFNINEYNI